MNIELSTFIFLTIRHFQHFELDHFFSAQIILGRIFFSFLDPKIFWVSEKEKYST